MGVATVGLDIAKQFFQAHGVDASGRVVLRKKLRRCQVAAFFANLPACTVGLEMGGLLRISLLGARAEPVRAPPSAHRHAVREALRQVQQERC